MQQMLPVSVQDAKDPLDRIADALQDGIYDLGVKVLLIPLQHRQEQILLGREEVVQAAAARVRGLEDLGNAGGSIALHPEQVAGYFHQAFARFRFGIHELVERSIKKIAEAGALSREFPLGEFSGSTSQVRRPAQCVARAEKAA